MTRRESSKRRAQPLSAILSPLERLFLRQVKRFHSRELARVWMAGYRRNPKHPGATAKTAPRADEWMVIFADCGDERIAEIMYEGYCFNM